MSKMHAVDTLSPAFTVTAIRSLIHAKANMYALTFGLVTGLFCTFTKRDIQSFAAQLNKYANFVLKKIILPLLPLLISGFIVKIHYEGMLVVVVREYGKLLIIISLVTYLYMFVALFVLSNCNIKSTMAKFKNLIPGISIGMFSMSSAAAIPSTIDACQKNIGDERIARFVVPATANMHLLGDCFVLPVIGLALMLSFGKGIPSMQDYFVFSVMGVLAKFSSAGIPGGSALVLMPVFIKTLGFTAEMCTAVTTIYILFDPIATSANVFGHGVFAELFNKVLKFVSSDKRGGGCRT